MRDKALDIFVVMLFGLGGIAILISAWAEPMFLLERIQTSFIGATGLLVAVIRVLRVMVHTS